MSLFFVFGDHELSVELPFPPHIEDRIRAVLAVIPGSPRAERAAADFVQGVVTIMTDVIERAPLPPSEKQIAYAVQVARTLNLELPANVLQLRDAAAAYLEEHAPEYRRRKAVERGELGSFTG